MQIIVTWHKYPDVKPKKSKTILCWNKKNKNHYLGYYFEKCIYDENIEYELDITHWCEIPKGPKS